MLSQNEALSGGFPDPVLDAQAVYRVVLDAMANPAQVMALTGLASPPEPLSPAAGAVALTLCDADTPVWLDDALAASPAVRTWLAFHTGAPVISAPENAAFAFLSAAAQAGSFELFSQGTQEYPDRSTTIIAQVNALGSGELMQFEGPGIRERAVLAISGLPANFAAQWRANRARFPRGVDLVLIAPQGIACLPRTARLVPTEA
jgi:alpha-D-ribose 1-methylphosphonate 5-triphosphate synthase subunit PhnH